MSTDSKFKETRLWQVTLAARPADEHSNSRDRLRTALLTMREQVIPLAAQVHQDCEGLTVHDVTHLDALWETANRIIGDEYNVNPIEAFVFGAAVLIHDAAMAIAAYPKGMETVKQSREWRDALIPALRKRGHDVDEKSIASLPHDVIRSSIFSVLRSLHASQAEKLMSMTWPSPTGGKLYLLEDYMLREYYGLRIGRIAHSHHWDITRLAEFNTNVTPIVGLPNEWVLNEVKVACMLRCADAAHIDHRRAPRMLYAIKSPKGVSDEHWRFQTKMGQIGVNGDKIMYSSSPFEQSEASAWWLAYDVMNLINTELQDSQRILEETGTQLFQVSRVDGIQSPRLLGKMLPPLGWEPISAEIRVTDPIHLALTLGGKNLYGEGFRAPIRELLQNAVDVVKARRGQRSVDEFPGKIRVVLEMVQNLQGHDELWLHVDDNGLGMTQYVMTGPLIDFGKSIWTAPQLKEQYPTLSGYVVHPIGKFGIGFFSVFLLGQDVRVTSRRYDAALKDALTLEFVSLDSRPILRKCRMGELPEEYSTRVSVKISRTDSSYSLLSQQIANYTMHICAALDVDVQLEDKLNCFTHTHSCNWLQTRNEDFIDELAAYLDAKERSEIKQMYAERLRPVIIDGKVCGRAALGLGGNRNQYGFLSVGGILYPSGGISFDFLINKRRTAKWHQEIVEFPEFVGVINGKTDDAARNFAALDMKPCALKEWLADQAQLIKTENYDLVGLVQVCHTIIHFDGDSRQLPFCYAGGKIVSLSRAIDIINRHNCIYVLLEKDYSDGIDWKSIGGLSAFYFVNDIYENVFCAAIRGDSFIDDKTECRRVLHETPIVLTAADVDHLNSSGSINGLMDVINKTWGNDISLSVEYANISNLRTGGNNKLVLAIRKTAT